MRRVIQSEKLWLRILLLPNQVLDHASNSYTDQNKTPNPLRPRIEVNACAASHSGPEESHDPSGQPKNRSQHPGVPSREAQSNTRGQSVNGAGQGESYYSPAPCRVMTS